MYNVTTLVVHTSNKGKFFVHASTTAEDQALVALGISGSVARVSAYAEFQTLDAANAALPKLQENIARLRIKTEAGENLGSLVVA